VARADGAHGRRRRDGLRAAGAVPPARAARPGLLVERVALPRDRVRGDAAQHRRAAEQAAATPAAERSPARSSPGPGTRT
jgi:hypothetical protein